MATETMIVSMLEEANLIAIMPKDLSLARYFLVELIRDFHVNFLTLEDKAMWSESAVRSNDLKEVLLLCSRHID